jgi:hypothetical protein
MTHPESQTPPNTRAPLNERLNKKLLSYAVAAGAAGVGILAAAQPADAEVVYTPTNTPIQIGVPVPIDLNNDGITDFIISNTYDPKARPQSCTQDCSFFEHAALKVSPTNATNGIWGATSTVSVFNAKRRGNKEIKKMVHVAVPAFWGIFAGKGPGRIFDQYKLIMDSTNASQTIFGFYSTRQYGPWGRGRKLLGDYLSFKFTVNGEIHYGWARVQVDARTPLEITATVTGYAYETVPNRGILTGFTQGTLDDSAEAAASAQQAQTAEPASLGRLAEGAGALSAWRTER